MSATRGATKTVKDRQAKVRCHSWVPPKETNRSSKIRAQGFLGIVFCLTAFLIDRGLLIAALEEMSWAEICPGFFLGRIL